MWPPVQHYIVQGLRKTGEKHAEMLAFNIAKKYSLATVSKCNSDLKKACEIYEKYDPSSLGEAGGGGEYEVQLGFGWSNGVRN